MNQLRMRERSSKASGLPEFPRERIGFPLNLTHEFAKKLGRVGSAQRMDRLQQLGYEKDFRIAFLEARGDAFQSLFERVMSLVHPRDFLACRPWGNVGDRKNDGYLPSERTLFQSYAPNEMTATEAVKKITEDFDGAKRYWEQYFDTWAFVHNAHDGRLGPHIIACIEDLRSKNPKIKLIPFGYQELLVKFRKVTLPDLESWFGPSITGLVNLNLGYQDLKSVLTHITQAQPLAITQIQDVSPGKIEANLLSDEVSNFLKIGMQKAALVTRFFERWPDPSYGEQVAAAFHEKYLWLRNVRPVMHPDEIFGQLEFWAAGTVDHTPQHKAAVLAVMAYLFDRCEIFEDAKAVFAP